MNAQIKKIGQRIKSVKVQGATAVATTVITSLRDYGLREKTHNLKTWRSRLKKVSQYLLSLRPTEPMAQNGVAFVLKEVNQKGIKDVQGAKRLLDRAVNRFVAMAGDAAALIIPQLKKILKDKENIFTHCHSYLVEESLKDAKRSGKKFQVFNTETRPLFQGHITAKHLLAAKIPVTMTTDSSSAFLISHYSGKRLMMNKILLGADAILKNGGAVNKIGSFGIGLTAKAEGVPLYVIAPLLKFYPKNWIKIERRSAKEIWSGAPKGLKIINFAFDFIPASYIKGIICEAGIIKPEEAGRMAKKIYPWI